MAIGILLALVSLIVLASVAIRRGSFESSVWVVWFTGSVFVVGISAGILIFYGSLFGICDPFGPFGTTGTFCTSFDPYEAIGPLLALISLIVMSELLCKLVQGHWFRPTPSEFNQLSHSARWSVA